MSADVLDGGTGKDRLDAGGDLGDTCTSDGAPDELVGCNGTADFYASDNAAMPTEEPTNEVDDPTASGGATGGQPSRPDYAW